MVSGSHGARSLRLSVRMFSRSAAMSKEGASKQGIWVWYMKERLAGKLPWKNNVARQIQALLITSYFFFSVVAKKKICLTKVNMVRIEGSCTNSNFRNKPLVYSS